MAHATAKDSTNAGLPTRHPANIRERQTDLLKKSSQTSSKLRPKSPFQHAAEPNHSLPSGTTSCRDMEKLEEKSNASSGSQLDQESKRPVMQSSMSIPPSQRVDIPGAELYPFSLESYIPFIDRGRDCHEILASLSFQDECEITVIESSADLLAPRSTSLSNRSLEDILNAKQPNSRVFVINQGINEGKWHIPMPSHLFVKLLIHFEVPALFLECLIGSPSFSSKKIRAKEIHLLQKQLFWCSIPTRMQIDDPHDHKHIVFNIFTSFDFSEEQLSTLIFMRTSSNWSGTVREAIGDIQFQLFELHKYFVSIQQNVHPFSVTLILLSHAVKYWRNSLTEVFYLVNAGEKNAHHDLSSLDVGELHDTARFLTGYSYDIAIILATIKALELQRKAFCEIQRDTDRLVKTNYSQSQLAREACIQEDIEAALQNITTAFDDIEASCKSLQKRTQSLLDLYFNMVAERNSFATGGMAFEMKRDSAAMKIIAILTVLLLPGTFASSFFGTNLFVVYLDESGTETFRATSIWWCWFIITVPLTIATLVGYIVWEYQRKKKEEESEVMDTLKTKWYSKRINRDGQPSGKQVEPRKTQRFSSAV